MHNICKHCGGTGWLGPYEQCPWCDGTGGSATKRPTIADAIERIIETTRKAWGWHNRHGLTNKETAMNVQEPCNHIYKAVPIDGSKEANVPCIPECTKCGYQPGSKLIAGVTPATNTDDGCIIQGRQLPDGRVVIDSVEYIKNPSKSDPYICTKCGADRSKEGCQNYNLLDCAFMGYSQTKEKK